MSYSRAQTITNRYSKNNLTQIAMPLGGIGAGSICLNGFGGLQDFSIRNRPNIGPLPDRFNRDMDAAFAVLHIKGKKSVTRLLEGPFPPERMFNLGLHGNGYVQRKYEGLPRFREATFEGAYPFGQVELSDVDIPLTAVVTGWNPFIPLDDVASSIPGAILEYVLHNPSKEKVEFEFSYHLSHLVPESTTLEGTRNTVIPGKGILFSNIVHPKSEIFGNASLTLISQKPIIKAMWLRGGWLDAISSLWRELESERFLPNDGKSGAGKSGRNGGSVLVSGKLDPGASLTIPVLITWYFPNSYLAIEKDKIPVDAENPEPKWRPFYTSQWKDAKDVATFVHKNYASLRTRTEAFQKALFSSTVPPEVIEAVSANLAIIKSPTVLRQENGNLWGWEGCFTDEGCCYGSCTHVWNYAQSIAHLFPGLERTLREQEFERSMDETGHVSFRSSLPDGPSVHDFHAAADGQLGGIMKLYRDWQISGDHEWMRRMYPLAKRSLEYCIRQWDPDRNGVLAEPHHNTYDVEFWGPDGMCSSVYVGALCAMSLLAGHVGEEVEAAEYQKLGALAAAFMDSELFNGEYYEQKVQYRGLRDNSFLKSIADKTSKEEKETLRILKKEGPKYQYGEGCLSDGIVGAWMAEIYGIPTPLNPFNVRKNLESIFRYNFRKNLVDHANPQRPGYAWGNEPGLLICSWPHGKKPTLPFPYSDEVMTGMEYQVAGHLITQGMVKEGLTIVRAIRSRFDGRIRNPWNEYECGSFYARAMASYALLGAFSGFRYSAVDQTLWFSPKLSKRPFSSFFSTASGYGVIRLDQNALTISLIEGSLKIAKACVGLKLGDATTDVIIKKELKAGKPFSIALPKRSDFKL